MYRERDIELSFKNTVIYEPKVITTIFPAVLTAHTVIDPSPSCTVWEVCSKPICTTTKKKRNYATSRNWVQSKTQTVHMYIQLTV